MAKNDLSEERARILAHVQRLEMYWRARNAIRDEDRSIYYLVEPPRRQGFEQITLNEPKVLWDTVVALLTNNSPRIRIPMTVNPDQAEKDRMNRVERLSLGILRELDSRQLRRGQLAWLRTLAWWVCSGWYAISPHVEKTDDGETHFWADLYNPNIVYPEWGVDCLRAVAKVYDTSAFYAVSMAEENDWEFDTTKKNNEPVKVVNYWWKEQRKVWNAVLMDDRFVSEPTHMDTFDEIPWVIGPVGGAPGQPDNELWQSRIGESIIASNRSLYAQKNRMASDYMQLVAMAARPPVVQHTKTGLPKVKKQDMGTGGLLTMTTEERLEAFKTVNTPGEFGTLLSMVGQSLQQGGLPYVAYGGLPFEMSGFAISQLLSAIRYKAGPYIIAMQEAINLTMKELLRQYQAYECDPIRLTTTDPNKLGRGTFYSEEFSRDDIPEHLALEVTLNIATPQDRMQQLLAAKQAITPPQLMSRETVWEDFLDVQDTALEYERLIGDQVNELPAVKTIAMIEGLREKVIDYMSKGMDKHADILKGYITQLEMSLGPAQPPVEGGAAATPGVGPETSPPEMGVTAPNPDMVRQMWKMGPPGLKRRPQTQEERAESKRQPVRAGAV